VRLRHDLTAGRTTRRQGEVEQLAKDDSARSSRCRSDPGKMTCPLVHPLDNLLTLTAKSADLRVEPHTIYLF
jgi:hypothetical protein